MGPILLLVCLPHILDVKKFGAFDKATPLVLRADGSSQPPVVHGRFFASKPGIRFDFSLKVDDGAGQLMFTLEEKSGESWNLIGGSNTPQRVTIPARVIDESRTEIDIPSKHVPSIEVVCHVKKEVPSEKSAVETEPAPKVVPPAEATGAPQPRAPKPPAPAGTRDAN